MYFDILDLISILLNKSKSVVHYELRTKSMINLYLLIMTNGRICFHFISHEFNTTFVFSEGYKTTLSTSNIVWFKEFIQFNSDMKCFL